MQENYIGLEKTQLCTPVLVIDRAILINNIKQMQDFAKKHNINVRPHAKTHKCSKIAKLQLENGCVGISVTKVTEAYELAKKGVYGILITSPIVSKNKIDILLEVLKYAPDTILVIDNIINAQEVNSRLQKHDLKLNVLLDIDGGIGRTGVCFDKAIEIASQVNKLSQLNFKGIQCYAGQLQHIQDINQRTIASKKILTKASNIKNQLIKLGINCEIQTGSGTGTFSIDAQIEGVTEIQPGSYTVMDKEYTDIEFKENKFLPAMTMLSTVISNNHSMHVTVDAGTKAMYKVDTRPYIISHEGLAYDWGGFGDEHGKVTANPGAKLPDLGEIIEMIVAHCDPTINLFDKFFITENNIVVDCWDIDLRGKCQ